MLIKIDKNIHFKAAGSRVKSRVLGLLLPGGVFALWLARFDLLMGKETDSDWLENFLLFIIWKVSRDYLRKAPKLSCVFYKMLIKGDRFTGVAETLGRKLEKKMSSSISFWFFSHLFLPITFPSPYTVENSSQLALIQGLRWGHLCVDVCLWESAFQNKSLGAGRLKLSNA